ncbi:MAG TPA: serine hydrolase [Gemmatimonadaceae bacterium]|nr:serine hydrolase [Gemmatimonadaceae bacterium]
MPTPPRSSIPPAPPGRTTLRSIVHGLSLACVAGTACARGNRVPEPPYPHAGEPIGTVRQSYDGALPPEVAVRTFRNIDRLFPSRVIAPSRTPRALPQAARPLTRVTFAHDGTTHDLEDYIRLNRVAGLLVLVNGEVALERYEFGNTPRTRWMSMSVAKSITSTLIGAALQAGHIRSLDDSVTRYVPALRGSAYEGVRIRDVLMMASGVKWDETYTDPSSDRRRLLEAQLSQVPGSALALMAKLPRAAEPGTRHNYSTGETQVAGEIVRGAVGMSLARYLETTIWGPAGMEGDATWWLDSPDGMEIGGSGIGATLRDYGRFGQFILEDGVAGGRRVLPDGWVREAGHPTRLRDGREIPYGYLWWTSMTAEGMRDGAFSAEGIHGQSVYINPAARVVIVTWGAQPRPSGGAVIDDDVVRDAIVRAVSRRPGE